MKPQLTNKQKKWLLWAGGVLLAYTLIGFVIVPWYIKSTLTDYVNDNTSASLSIERLYLNPFTFYTKASKITLQDADGAEMVAVDELQLNLDVTGLFRKVLVISDFRLLQLKVNAVVDAEGNINLVQGLAISNGDSDKDAESSAGLDFLLALAAIENGQVSITDNSSQPQRQATVDAINLSLENITSIKQESGDYNFSLLLGDDASIKTSGDLVLNPLTVHGDFALDKIGLAQVLTWVQEFVPLLATDGLFSANGDYAVSVADDALAFRLENTAARLEAVSLQDTYTTLATSFDEFAIEDAAFDSESSSLKLGTAALQGLAAKTPAGDDYAALASLSLSDIELNVNELQLATGNLKLEKLVLLPRPEGAVAELNSLSLQALAYTRADGVLLVDAIQLAETIARLPIDTDGRLDLPPLPLTEQENAPIENNEAEEEAGPSALQQLQVGNVAITGLDVMTQSSAAEAVAENLLDLGEFQLRDINMDMNRAALNINEVTLQDTAVNLAINARQKLNVAQLFAGTDATGEPSSTDTDEPETTPFAYAIDKLNISGTSVGLNNNGLANAVQHQLTEINLDVQAISSADDQRATFALAANVGTAEKAQLTVNGSVVPSTRTAQADIKLSGLDLAPFNPYLQETTLLKLDEGKLGLSAAVELLPDETGIKVTDGAITLGNVKLSNAASGVSLFATETIAVEKIGYESTPAKLAIGKVLATKPYVNIFIDEAGNLNLAQQLKESEVEPAPASADTAAQSSPLQFEVKSIELQEGRMDFSDQSLLPKFSTNINNLNGVATGLSSNVERFATLALTGNVNEFGSTTITGELQPFSIEQQTEIDMEFVNIDTSSLTPYTAKFAGRKIKSGRLSLTISYKVKDGKLDGNNNIVLKSLLLGDRVESPDAMDLPLDMAISLLEDSDGKIDLNVPISGDLDNPQFDIGSVIRKAVGNLVTGIVTSPFQFLGSLLGGDAKDLNIVEFQPGSARIMPAEAEKLTSLDTALESRPALALTITGRYAPGRDTTALARVKLREQVAASSEQPPGPINTSDPDIQDILDDLGDERIDPETRKQLQNDRKEQASAEDKQAATKAYYDALVEKLVNSYAALVTESDLRNLATQRAEATRDYLVTVKPGMAGRINISDKVINKVADTGAVTLELEIDRVK